MINWRISEWTQNSVNKRVLFCTNLACEDLEMNVCSKKKRAEVSVTNGQNFACEEN